MNSKTKIIFSILFILTISCTVGLLICSALTKEKHTGTITVKWSIPKLLVTYYYFELDNETEVKVKSYDYHKYNVGDEYTYETWRI